MNLLGRAVVRLFDLNERVVDRVMPPPVQGPMDTDGLDWARDLEAHWTEIRAEYEALVADDVRLPRLADVVATDPYDATSQANKDGGEWRTFILWSTGHRIDRNCARCPTTARLVEQVPNMTSAMFSVFAPHTHLPTHRAPNKGSMRYQLALVIPGPKGACRIRIGPTTYEWVEGESLLFDHAVDHEAWNDTDEPRIVLFLETVMDVPFPASILNSFTQRMYGWFPNARQVRDRLEELDGVLGNEDVRVRG